MTDRQRRDDRIVNSLRSAVNDGRLGLDDVPGLVKKVLRARMWRDRVISQTGERARFDSFAAFVEAQPLEGLGTNLKMLQRLCADDREALDLIDRAVERRHGGRRTSSDSKHDDVTLEPRVDGNSRQYALRRLRRDRPDLHARVLAGDLTPNGAMALAGFRRPTFVVPAEPVAAAATLARRFQARETEVLIDALTEIVRRRAITGV